MITLKEYLELIDYKITEGSDYGWECYGPDTYTLSSWNGIHGKGGFSFNCVFSTEDQTVYEVEVCDYTNDRAYRMINPDYVAEHRAEAEDRNVDERFAWDEVAYIDLDVLEDFLQKSHAIKVSEVYDTRIIVPLDLPDEQMFDLMKLAHAADMTLNTYVEMILQKVIDNDTREID